MLIGPKIKTQFPKYKEIMEGVKQRAIDKLETTDWPQRSYSDRLWLKARKEIHVAFPDQNSEDYEPLKIYFYSLLKKDLSEQFESPIFQKKPIVVSIDGDESGIEASNRPIESSVSSEVTANASDLAEASTVRPQNFDSLIRTAPTTAGPIMEAYIRKHFKELCKVLNAIPGGDFLESYTPGSHDGALTIPLDQLWINNEHQEKIAHICNNLSPYEIFKYSDSQRLAIHDIRLAAIMIQENRAPST
jgi:hypothetical protein